MFNIVFVLDLISAIKIRNLILVYLLNPLSTHSARGGLYVVTHSHIVIVTVSRSGLINLILRRKKVIYGAMVMVF